MNFKVYSDMLLVLEVGNTSTKFAIYNPERLIQLKRVLTSALGTSKEILTLLNLFLTEHDQIPQAMTGAILCSVVPSKTELFIRAIEKSTTFTPLVVSSALNLGLTISVEPPEGAGADRLADVVAAEAKYGFPVIVVDLGTATTFSVVDSQRRYIGGAIHPGVTVSWDAFRERAPHLPQVPVEPPATIIGLSTMDSLRSAAFYGTISLIDGMVRLFQSEMGIDSCPVIMTGGNGSDLLCDASITVTAYDPLLTLEGTQLIWQRNVKA